jgi:ABC-type phosphate transport system substrate-binding protein
VSRHARALRRLLVCLAVAAAGTAAAAEDAAAQPPPRQYAVVVHPSTTVDDVSLAQLRRIFLGEQQFWSGGSRVALLIQPPGAPARAAVLSLLYRMGEQEFTRYWIAKIFRNDVASGPKVISSARMVRALVATIPGAVAVLPLEDVDASVKVLRVDGRLPGSAGYALDGGRS